MIFEILGIIKERRSAFPDSFSESCFRWSWNEFHF